MAEERPAYETLLDAFVYAPLGAALALADELPRLADRGRARFEKRVAVARVVGRFAVEEARRRVGGRAPDPCSGPARSPEESTRDRALAREDTAPKAAAKSAAAFGEIMDVRGEPSGSESGRAGASGAATKLATAELPIPAYDTLAASQVVERLLSLTAAELEAVRNHESATRRRRTVLHRIAQLSSERDSDTA